MIKVAILLEAKKTARGEYRRVFVVKEVDYEKATFVAAVDEQGRGIPALKERFPDAVFIGGYKTTPSIYRRWLRFQVKVEKPRVIV